MTSFVLSFVLKMHQRGTAGRRDVEAVEAEKQQQSESDRTDFEPSPPDSAGFKDRIVRENKISFNRSTASID